MEVGIGCLAHSWGPQYHPGNILRIQLTFAECKMDQGHEYVRRKVGWPRTSQRYILQPSILLPLPMAPQTPLPHLNPPSGLAPAALPSLPAPGHGAAAAPAPPPHERASPPPESSSTLSPPVLSWTLYWGRGREQNFRIEEGWDFEGAPDCWLCLLLFFPSKDGDPHSTFPKGSGQ